VELWRIDPESFSPFNVFLFADHHARTSPTLTHHQSACTDQPHMTSPTWSWTISFLFLAGLLLPLSFPRPTSAPIADSLSFPFWLMFSSFGSFLSHTLVSFIPNVCQHGLCAPGLCAGSYSIYIPVPTSCSSSLSLSISSSRQFRPLHQRLLRLLSLVPRQVSSTCSFILSYLFSPLDHHL